VIAACGSDDDEPGSASPAATSAATAQASACEKQSLDLKSGGKLTIGTDKPAYPPYFQDDDPANGKGFESAVAYAVAKELGFQPAEVTWKTVPFNSSYAPGDKPFDFDINQISITPKRAQRVDFSDPYFEAPQAVIALKSTAAAKATSLAELAKAKLGVQVGTTSLDAVKEKVEPSKDPKVFNDSNDVVTALKQNQVDAIVTDLPTAFYITAAQVPGSKIAGQFNTGEGDSFGLLLEKGSKLTPCVDKAIGELDSSGELKKITDRWMGEAAGAPELELR